MKSNSLSDVEQNLSQTREKISKKSNNLDFSKNLSNSNLSNDSQKDISKISLNMSLEPMNLSSGTNQTVFGQNNINTNQNKEEEGVFSRIFNYIRNAWTIEEEEFIDAYGFKAKRPKKKISLRKKEDKYNSDIQKVGGQSMLYATQNSGFGNLFL